MKSASLGKRTSDVEVTNVSKHGLWILMDQREMFLPFDRFPWFKEAPISKILCVELPQPHHLYWPELDIDLAVESIEQPEKYPLVSKVKLALSKPKRRAASGPRAKSGRPGGRRS